MDSTFLPSSVSSSILISSQFCENEWIQWNDLTQALKENETLFNREVHSFLVFLLRNISNLRDLITKEFRSEPALRLVMAG